jgi:hypothetical protein
MRNALGKLTRIPERGKELHMESMSTARSNQILVLLATAALMGVLDFSRVNVALPSIQQTFHLAPAAL